MTHFEKILTDLFSRDAPLAAKAKPATVVGPCAASAAVKQLPVRAAPVRPSAVKALGVCKESAKVAVASVGGSKVKKTVGSSITKAASSSVSGGSGLRGVRGSGAVGLGAGAGRQSSSVRPAVVRPGSVPARSAGLLTKKSVSGVPQGGSSSSVRVSPPAPVKSTPLPLKSCLKKEKNEKKATSGGDDIVGGGGRRGGKKVRIVAVSTFPKFKSTF